MKLNNTFLLIVLAIITLIAIGLAIWLPSRTKVVNLDWNVYDQNDNFQLEVGENLEFRINDTTAFDEVKMLWEFGNGDSIVQMNKVNYSFKKKGNYLVTLTIDDILSIPKKLTIIEVTNNRAVDSIPKIYGVDKRPCKRAACIFNQYSWYNLMVLGIWRNRYCRCFRAPSDL